MLPLEREREKGKRTASEQRKKSQLSPPPFLFLFYFPAEANGKCQYLEANGVSGYIWVANTFCSKQKMNPRQGGRGCLLSSLWIRYSERLCLVLEVIVRL